MVLSARRAISSGAGERQPRGTDGRRVLHLLGGVTVAVLALWTATASAYWHGSGEGNGPVALAAFTAPTISSASPAAEAVVLTWTAVSAPAAGTVEYYVTRDGGAPSAGCPSSSSRSTVTTCTDAGVALGTHEYTVTAVWRSWSATSAARPATVTYGPATHLVLEAASTAPHAGEADNLTITAKDASNVTVKSFSGSHPLTFEGATEAPSGTKPAVTDTAGTERPFGESTEISFTEGVATVSTGRNGAMKLYRVEEAHVKVKEGGLGSGTGLAVKVAVGAFKSFSVAASNSEPEAGIAFEEKLIAWDEWHNVITAYSRTNKLHYEGAESLSLIHI